MTFLTSLWLQLVRSGLYLLYHQLAPTYDLVSWIVSFGRWRTWQLAALPFVKGPDVLELGHGPGHMLLALQRAGYKTTGADLSPQMGRLARNKIRASGASIAVVRAPVQNLPFKSAGFDTILATFPTEFIAQEACLKEVHRVLRENGRFVVLPQARLTGESPPVRLLEGLYRITGQRSVPDTTGEQVTPSSLLTLMQRRFNETGFECAPGEGHAAWQRGDHSGCSEAGNDRLMLPPNVRYATLSTVMLQTYLLNPLQIGVKAHAHHHLVVNHTLG